MHRRFVLMMTRLQLMLCIVTLCQVTASKVATCRRQMLEREFQPTEHRRLVQFSYLQKVTKSQVICVSYCHSDPGCESVNYDVGLCLCELNNATRVQFPGYFVEHGGSVYFDANVEASHQPKHGGFLPPRPIWTHRDATYYNSSCQGLLEAGHNLSGIYTIFPAGFGDGLQVYCDMDPDGGWGWIVVQRRQDGSVDFYRNWEEYRVGFGNLSGEFWLGNDNIRTLTELEGTWQLQIKMEDWQNITALAEYRKFQISGDNFTLHVGSYNANSSASDSLAEHNGMKFSTEDRDNDLSTVNCAQSYKGAWWFNSCYKSNLNGRFQAKARGISWSELNPIKECSMNIRPYP